MSTKISVILPAYNAEKYLRVAVDSILSQSYGDFELLIINDGSTDSTKEIILSYKDERVKYIENEKNLGLIETLNKGILLSKGKYIARMDADDICHLSRFQMQIDFMEKNPEYIICSSSRKEFTQNISDFHLSKLPVDDISIRIHSIFSTPFTHPAVMFRSSIIKENNLFFENDYKYAEDYQLWIKILQYGKGYNFKMPLLYYRNTPNSQTTIGASQVEERKKTISNIQQLALKEQNIILDQKELNLIYILSLSDKIRNINFEDFSVDYILSFFKKLSLELKTNYPDNKFNVSRVLGKRYLKILLFNVKKMRFTDLLKLAFSMFTLFGIYELINEKIRS
ncbi:glycosyltransferase family 2 protein [Chryseobacterium elymi]|uniref:Glycosyltransferase family 2 protein n=1 Tax=Chryseobacterium elymi TaxID=395936 RepID=A0A3D9DPJ5_9FLAO|nr:glycosyltransferase [Chryseobacterium elymi]REC79913.1 glycosyltransferase family 2 protein [Chryseobacterium elymi]